MSAARNTRGQFWGEFSNLSTVAIDRELPFFKFSFVSLSLSLVHDTFPVLSDNKQKAQNVENEKIMFG